MDLKNTNVDGGSQDVVAVAEINIFLGARHLMNRQKILPLNQKYDIIYYLG